MAWLQLWQGVIWAPPHLFVSLCPFVGVQMSFYRLSQQLTQSIILASKYIFPSTLSYLLSVLEPLAFQIDFLFFSDTLFRRYSPLYPAVKV